MNFQIGLTDAEIEAMNHWRDKWSTDACPVCGARVDYGHRTSHQVWHSRLIRIIREGLDDT